MNARISKIVKIFACVAIALAMILGCLQGVISQTVYQIQLYPIADAYVLSTAPDINYGASSTIRLYYGSAGNYYILKFNLTGVITQQMPNLRFYLKLNALNRYGAGSYYLRVHPYPNNWYEGNITWNNKPGTISYTTTIKYIQLPAGSTLPEGGWYVLDITNYIIANCLNNVCSLAVVYAYNLNSDNNLETHSYIDFATKEYSDQNKWPHLLIEYSALTTITQTITVTSTETATQTDYATVTTTTTTTQTLTDYVVQTQTTTTTITDTIYTTQTEYATTTLTQTVTQTETVTDIIYTKTTTTQTLTIWDNATVTTTQILSSVPNEQNYYNIVAAAVAIVIVLGIVSALLKKH